MRSFLAALAVLIIVPVRLREPFSQKELVRSRYRYIRDQDLLLCYDVKQP